MEWASAVVNIPYSYTLELRGLYIPGNGLGFAEPASEIIPTAEETWAFHEVTTVMSMAPLTMSIAGYGQTDDQRVWI